MPATAKPPAANDGNPLDRPFESPVGSPIDAVDEDREIERVVIRLRDRYPALDLATISDAVSVSRHAYDGARVRRFVPLLVERMAEEMLKRDEQGELRERL